MGHSVSDPAAKDRRAWNADRVIGAKRALKPLQVWATRFWRDHEDRLRDRAMFDLSIDSKLRGSEVVRWLRETKKSVESRLVAGRD
jgi:hypothetical protein